MLIFYCRGRLQMFHVRGQLERKSHSASRCIKQWGDKLKEGLGRERWRQTSCSIFTASLNTLRKTQKPEQRKYQLLHSAITAYWVYWSVKSARLRLGTPTVHTMEQTMQSLQLTMCPQWIITPPKQYYEGKYMEIFICTFYWTGNTCRC